MYEIQCYSNYEHKWVRSGNMDPNYFDTRRKAEESMKKNKSENMDYRVMHIGDAETDELDLINLKAQIKAILAEPSKLQRIAKLLEEK